MMGIIKLKILSSGYQFAARCFNLSLNAVFSWDAAVVVVKLQPALEALVAKLQQAVVVLVDDGDVPLPCDGAGRVHNNTSYDFYNNIFFVEPAKKLLLPGMQQ